MMVRDPASPLIQSSTLTFHLVAASCRYVVDACCPRTVPRTTASAPVFASAGLSKCAQSIHTETVGDAGLEHPVIKSGAASPKVASGAAHHR